MSGAGRTRRTPALRISAAGATRTRETLAAEEPLLIRLVAGRAERTLAVMMRTPGNDFELAAGWLFAEGIVRARDEIHQIRYCTDDEQQFNNLSVVLRAAALPDTHTIERHFATSSACGVCGASSLDALAASGCEPLDNDMIIDSAILLGLPEQLRPAQQIFAATGGLHAAALFDGAGRLLAVREDVGRHNALDKLVGWALLDGNIDLTRCVALMSGRASFELAQKCVRARIPILCAVSAPSSMAVDVARRFGLTLAGFVRDGRATIYTGEGRVAHP